jgi:hypothetical protein
MSGGWHETLALVWVYCYVVCGRQLELRVWEATDEPPITIRTMLLFFTNGKVDKWNHGAKRCLNCLNIRMTFIINS